MAEAYTINGDNVFGLPAHIAVGLVGSGSDFVDVGLAQRVDIKPKFFVQSITNQVGQQVGTPLRAFIGFDVSIMLREFDSDQIVALLPALTVKGTSGGVGWNSDVIGLTRISLHVRTLAAIAKNPSPLVDPKGWWFPSLEPSDISNLIFKVEEGESVQEDFTISYKSYRTTKDFTSTPRPINVAGQLGFQGGSLDVITGDEWEDDLPARFRT